MNHVKGRGSEQPEVLLPLPLQLRCADLATVAWSSLTTSQRSWLILVDITTPTQHFRVFLFRFQKTHLLPWRPGQPPLLEICVAHRIATAIRSNTLPVDCFQPLLLRHLYTKHCSKSTKSHGSYASDCPFCVCSHCLPPRRQPTPHIRCDICFLLLTSKLVYCWFPREGLPSPNASLLSTTYL